jgi:IclR family pca regulon transcriptional regulator
MPRVSARPLVAAPGPFGEWREPVPRLREMRYSQSLERGLAILECFAPERPVWGIAEMADELGMSRSTTHRYVITLVELGYLVRDASRRYRLRLGVIDLGLSALSSTSLRVLARPYLEELGRRASYTVAVAVLDGPDVLCVERIRGGRRGQRLVDVELGEDARLPVYCTAMGKLLAANLSPQEQQKLVAELKLVRRGPNTVCSKRALLGELARVAGGSVVVGDQELAAGLYEIAAPVRSPAREVIAAVGLVAHHSMISLEQLVERLGPHLVSTADRISAQVGYRRDDEAGGLTGA